MVTVRVGVRVMVRVRARGGRPNAQFVGPMGDRTNAMFPGGTAALFVSR